VKLVFQVNKDNTLLYHVLVSFLKVAKDAQDQMCQHWSEVAVGSEGSGLRVVLGQGGQVTDLLMPGEIRKVLISKANEGVTEENIKLKFGRYGTIIRCGQFKQGDTYFL
jgi:hypothetical protein